MRKIWLLTGFVIVFLFTGCEEPTQTGYIKVSSNPTGASIYLDGDYSGETDRLISDVLVGSHELRLELDDYEPWQGTVVVEEDDTALIDVTLEVLWPTPEILWTYEAEGYIRGCPAIAEDGTIYFGTWLYFYALNPDGYFKWRYDAGDRFDFSAAICSDGTIYLPVGEYMFALDPQGNFKWSYQTGARIYSSPAIGTDSTIYFGSRDYYFYAVTPEGDLKWQYPTDDEIVSSPAIASDGTIYFECEDHWLYALNSDGELEWRYPVGPSEAISPAIGADGTIYAVSRGALYAISKGGNLIWKYEIDNISGSPVVGPDGTIYFCGEYYPNEEEEYYGIYAINPDGTLKWIEGPLIHSSLAIASDGSLYIPGYCLDSDGEIQWKYSHEDLYISYCPAIGIDGTVYYGAGSTMFAIKGNSQGLANSSWPKFRGDAQNTGRVNIP